jgi:hypothetical protein
MYLCIKIFIRDTPSVHQIVYIYIYLYIYIYSMSATHNNSTIENLSELQQKIFQRISTKRITTR